MNFCKQPWSKWFSIIHFVNYKKFKIFQNNFKHLSWTFANNHWFSLNVIASFELFNCFCDDEGWNLWNDLFKNISTCSRHGGLPAKGKEVFVYTSGLEIEWTQMINSGFVVTGPLRTLWLLYCTIFSGTCFDLSRIVVNQWLNTKMLQMEISKKWKWNCVGF